MLLNAGISFNFGVLPVPVLDRTKLSPNARLCLAVLDGFGKNVIYPHLPTIARRMGFAEASTKTVIAALVELVQAGFLDVRGGRGAHAPNYYFLKIPLYCRVEDPLLAAQIQLVPFPVNLMSWKPAIPGAGVIPAGHCQLSNGQVVPLDDVPKLAPAAAAAAGTPDGQDPGAVPAQVGAMLEAAISSAIAAVGCTPEALALGQRLAALVAGTCRMHEPGGPMGNIRQGGAPMPAPAAALGAPSVQFAGKLDPVDPISDQSAAPGAVVVFEKNVFFGPKVGETNTRLSQNDTSIVTFEPSRPAARDPKKVLTSQAWPADTVNRAGQPLVYSQTENLSNEREIRPLPSSADAIKNLEAWQLWPAVWEKSNPGRTWAWTIVNLQLAATITAAVGVDLLAGTLQNFSCHSFWSKNRLPLQALAKNWNEYLPAITRPAATIAATGPKPCDHSAADQVETFTAAAVVIQIRCACGHSEETMVPRADLLATAAALPNGGAAAWLAKIDQVAGSCLA